MLYFIVLFVQFIGIYVLILHIYITPIRIIQKIVVPLHQQNEILTLLALANHGAFAKSQLMLHRSEFEIDYARNVSYVGSDLEFSNSQNLSKKDLVCLLSYYFNRHDLFKLSLSKSELVKLFTYYINLEK